MGTVRVVEDSADLAKWLQILLELAGFAVDVVTERFEELLDVDRWVGVDAAVIDFQLKGDVNGGMLCLFLEQQCPHVRRVLFSALSRSAMALADHADVVLLKGNVHADEIVQAVTGCR